MALTGTRPTPAEQRELLRVIADARAERRGWDEISTLIGRAAEPTARMLFITMLDDLQRSSPALYTSLSQQYAGDLDKWLADCRVAQWIKDVGLPLPNPALEPLTHGSLSAPRVLTEADLPRIIEQVRAALQQPAPSLPGGAGGIEPDAWHDPAEELDLILASLEYLVTDTVTICDPGTKLATTGEELLARFATVRRPPEPA